MNTKLARRLEQLEANARILAERRRAPLGYVPSPEMVRAMIGVFLEQGWPLPSGIQLVKDADGSIRLVKGASVGRTGAG